MRLLPVFKTDVRAQVTRMQEAYFEDPNPHHLFLLVLVKHGLATPYDMLSKLGLGVGATSPPLKRMEKAGLLTGTSQPRRSTRYAITEKGEEELRSQIESGRMRHWWIEESYVYRSTPRAMFLSWLYSGPKQISDCVDVAMQELRFLAHKKKQEAQAIRETIPRFEANCRHSGLADDEGLFGCRSLSVAKSGVGCRVVHGADRGAEDNGTASRKFTFGAKAKIDGSLTPSNSPFPGRSLPGR